MDEGPDRSIIDLEAPPSELGHKAAQGEVSLLYPLPQPGLMLVPDRLGLVPAHLAWRDAPRLPKPLHPLDRRAHPDAKA